MTLSLLCVTTRPYHFNFRCHDSLRTGLYIFYIASCLRDALLERLRPNLRRFPGLLGVQKVLKTAPHRGVGKRYVFTTSYVVYA